MTCSLYFTAHPEEKETNTSTQPVETRVSISKEQSAAAADVVGRKTNPNWIDICYDPQHLRFARDGNPHVPWSSSSSPSSSSSSYGGQHHRQHRHYRSASAASDSSASVAVAKTGLRSGAAKVKRDATLLQWQEVFVR